VTKDYFLLCEVIQQLKKLKLKVGFNTIQQLDCFYKWMHFTP